MTQRVKVEFVIDYEGVSHATAIARTMDILPGNTRSINIQSWTLKSKEPVLPTDAMTQSRLDRFASATGGDLGDRVDAAIAAAAVAVDSWTTMAKPEPECPDCTHPRIMHSSNGCMAPGEGDKSYCDCTNKIGKTKEDGWEAPAKPLKPSPNATEPSETAVQAGGPVSIEDGAQDQQATPVPIVDVEDFQF
jgi:hypothetical protein